VGTRTSATRSPPSHRTVPAIPSRAMPAIRAGILAQGAPKINEPPSKGKGRAGPRRRSRYVPEAANTIQATSQQSGGRQVWTPVAIPAAKASAAQSRGAGRSTSAANGRVIGLRTH
jgi:hypothetical protein